MHLLRLSNVEVTWTCLLNLSKRFIHAGSDGSSWCRLKSDSKLFLTLPGLLTRFDDRVTRVKPSASIVLPVRACRNISSLPLYFSKTLPGLLLLLNRFTGCFHLSQRYLNPLPLPLYWLVVFIGRLLNVIEALGRLLLNLCSLSHVWWSRRLLLVSTRGHRRFLKFCWLNSEGLIKKVFSIDLALLVKCWSLHRTSSPCHQLAVGVDFEILLAKQRRTDKESLSIDLVLLVKWLVSSPNVVPLSPTCGRRRFWNFVGWATRDW